MPFRIRQISISLAALLLALFLTVYIARNPAWLGELPLLLRGLVVNGAVLAAVIAAYPLNPLFRGRPSVYVLAICLPSLIPAFIYFLLLLPAEAREGFVAEQLRNQLISDRSSNGIVEVGFAYPIYTPTISVTNTGLYTRRVNVFLRMIDSNNQATLFRAVRDRIPGTQLSVESTVRGMLTGNQDFLFLPLELPPGREVSGQLVFIISTLDDGTSFTEALGRVFQAQFELRDPETGILLAGFPVDRF